ncbi:hypothetical protein KL905_003926 [Ogataea polymorpha]|uniref:Nudix hydrolase domain-containing protein n=2 Tax=Ogataea polymorpha TaxID=460523 RepID=A0A9P8P5E8_9ASCO|nr:hypothetical protein KL908_004589 [Ogataea polymorpha]KAG7898589.1 hypothetical protein KL935_004188 [Ogataea polymorpha]KAG7901556.1 hypothetical protein KL907_004226 [Ogataea polymorpha]KAG7907051.1 hypothetical protein KL906_004237 [Ogataea polymorpha]KAG7914703.1 hypothetical protein KL927_004372 [Ogataea polymorpha]
MSILLRKGFADESLERVLEDLLVRFVINCPPEDLSSIERVFFQIEEAHWFYQDFARVVNELLPPMKMKQFTAKIIAQCPVVWRWGDSQDALAQFGKYKSSIPVRGCAVLNQKLDKVLLVKGVESSSWGFPRGKISKDETDLDCALRELEEETGFDGREYIDEDEYIERTIQGKNYKIYILAGVPESTKFEPRVRNEICAIAWKDIKSLSKQGKNNLFLVSSMMKQLQNFINKKKYQQTEEELKKQATIQLKKILGVGQPQEKSDPGRDLLNMLQQVSAGKQPPNLQPPSMPMPGHHMPLPMPLAPFPMPFPMPFMMAPHMLPRFPFPPPPAMSVPRSDQKNELFAPPPSSLDKPHMALANRRSGESNSKELLSILKRPEKKDETEEAHKPRGSFLQNLFDKYDAEEPAQVPRKVTILKRPKEQESSEKPGASLLNLLQQKQSPTTNGSSELLNILKKPEPQPKDDSKQLLDLLKHKPANQNGANGANGSAELLDMLKKPAQPEQPAQASASPSASVLLGILNRKEEPRDPSKGLLDAIVPPTQSGSSGSQELLSLLKPASSSAPTSAPESSNEAQKPSQEAEEYEDFEDFDDLNEGYENVRSSNHFKTYVSDEEEVYL